jgi:hypothetical protein
VSKGSLTVSTSLLPLLLFTLWVPDFGFTKVVDTHTPSKRNEAIQHLVHPSGHFYEGSKSLKLIRRKQQNRLSPRLVQQQDPPKTLKREITIQIVTESEEQQNQ